MQVSLTTTELHDGQVMFELLQAGQQACPSPPQGPSNNNVLATAQLLWDSAQKESRTSAEDEQAVVSPG